MDRMINTPIMTEKEIELVNSLTTSILETSILDAFSIKKVIQVTCQIFPFKMMIVMMNGWVKLDSLHQIHQL